MEKSHFFSGHNSSQILMVRVRIPPEGWQLGLWVRLLCGSPIPKPATGLSHSKCSPSPSQWRVQFPRAQVRILQIKTFLILASLAHCTRKPGKAWIDSSQLTFPYESGWKSDFSESILNCVSELGRDLNGILVFNGNQSEST